MIEQMNLFGERDEFAVLIDHIVKWYEDKKAFCARYGYPMPRNFGEWLLDLFSTYTGGNGSEMLWGKWEWYAFSPSGLKLEGEIDDETEKWDSIFFPKKKILDAFGIKDDRKDALKEGSE